MISSAVFAASLIRFGRIAHIAAVSGFDSVITFADLSLVITGIWIGALYHERLYDPDRVFWGTGEYSRVVRALSLGIVGFILATYLLKVPGLSRGWMVLAWSLGVILVILGRMVVRTALGVLRRRGRMQRPALIVGANDEAVEIAEALRSNTDSGLVPVACLASTESQFRQSACLPMGGSVPCIGFAGEIRDALDRQFIDTVVIVSTAFEHDAVARIINELRGRDVDIQMSSGLLDVTTSRVAIREVSGIPLITIKAVVFSRRNVLVKRAFDLLVGGLIVLLGIPLWLLIATGIKLGSQGPVFYRQERVGRGGETFWMYKFRSMYQGADGHREKLAAANEASGPLFKMQDDPRVTRIGKWMRKYSVDEFPQLINVLKGEMSLVGPRPPLPGETASYTDHHWRRMEVVPGMTGLWQVSGRSGLSFDEMIRLDLLYIENWSVGFDLGLLLRTVPAVVFARGAY